MAQAQYVRRSIGRTALVGEPIGKGAADNGSKFLIHCPDANEQDAQDKHPKKRIFDFVREPLNHRALLP